jgi:hypothetical protein
MIKIRKIKKVGTTESRYLKNIGDVDVENFKVKTSNMFNNFSKVHIYPQIVTENIEEGDLIMYKDTWTLYIIDDMFEDLTFRLKYVIGRLTWTFDFTKVANYGGYKLYD